MPSACSSAVTGSLRLRSMRTLTMSLASNSKSSQLPRYGMTRAAKRYLPLAWVLPRSWSNRTPGRAVHLADDDALGAVDDEGAVHRHERHVAHVDVLLLDIDHRLGLGLGIDLERGQAQGDAHRRGIGQAALAALVGVVFRMLELVMIEIEVRRAGEVHDREHRAERLLETRDIARLLVRAEELLVALALNLDEVRHLARFRGCCRRSCGFAADLVLGPLVVLRGASIALVAMCFPALCGTRRDPALPLDFAGSSPAHVVERCPATLSNAFGPCANSDPVPERTGKAPGARHRAAEPSICWMRPI